MTVRQALAEGFRVLGDAGVDTATLDATVLLAEVLRTTKERLFATLPDQLSDSALRAFRDFLSRRLEGTPVSYLRKRKEFYGLELVVDERVLVPRPETETLVEQALHAIAWGPGVVRLHDTCTGSGCVAIVCAGEFPALEVSVSDISWGALEACQENSLRILERELDAWQSDLLDEVPGSYDVITANPPYLSDAEVDEMRAAGWPEPEVALRGGPEGLDVLRRLVEQAPEHLSCRGTLLVECGSTQCGAVAAYMRKRGWDDVQVASDLAGLDRVVSGRLRA